jgi:hypothetical protein
LIGFCHWNENIKEILEIKNNNTTAFKSINLFKPLDVILRFHYLMNNLMNLVVVQLPWNPKTNIATVSISTVYQEKSYQFTMI